MTTVQSLHQSDKGTEDVMETSSDLGYVFQGAEDVDIDLDLGDDGLHSERDADMMEDLDDLAMPTNSDLQGIDAPMEDEMDDQAPPYQQHIQTSNPGAESAKDGPTSVVQEEDLLDEAEDITEYADLQPTPHHDEPDTASLADLTENDHAHEPSEDHHTGKDEFTLSATEASKDQDAHLHNDDADRDSAPSGSSRPPVGDPPQFITEDFKVADSTRDGQLQPSDQPILNQSGVEQADQVGEWKASTAASHSEITMKSIKRDQPESLVVQEKQQELHPVIIQYHGEEYYLFPLRGVDHESSEPILTLQHMARGGVLNVLDACRSKLQDDIPIDHELEMLIEDLGLRIGESNTSFPNISFADIINNYVELCRNDGNLDPDPLYIRLYLIPVPSKRWEHLLGLVRQGSGLSQASEVENSYFYTPDFTATEERGDDTLNNNETADNAGGESPQEDIDEEEDELEEMKESHLQPELSVDAGPGERHSDSSPQVIDFAGAQATEQDHMKTSTYFGNEKMKSANVADQSTLGLSEDALALTSAPRKAKSLDEAGDSAKDYAPPDYATASDQAERATVGASTRISGVSINQKDIGDKANPLQEPDLLDDVVKDEDDLEDEYQESNTFQHDLSAGDHQPEHDGPTEPPQTAEPGETLHQPIETTDAVDDQGFETGIGHVPENANERNEDDLASDESSLLDFEEPDGDPQEATTLTADEEATLDAADPNNDNLEDGTIEAAATSPAQTSPVPAADFGNGETQADSRASLDKPSKPGRVSTDLEPRLSGLKRQHEGDENEVSEDVSGEGAKRVRSS